MCPTLVAATITGRLILTVTITRLIIIRPVTSGDVNTFRRRAISELLAGSLITRFSSRAHDLDELMVLCCVSP